MEIIIYTNADIYIWGTDYPYIFNILISKIFRIQISCVYIYPYNWPCIDSQQQI